MRAAHLFALSILLLTGRAALAQGIDCSKARTPVETAICASASLRALDRQVGAAYADAVARDETRAAALRQAQRLWLHERDAACGRLAAQRERCLAAAMTSRLAALTPSRAPAATPATAAPPPTGSVPTAALPAPAATITPATFPAAAETDALLTVTSPGRFAIIASSKTGTALQLVDMLTGPSDVAGAAGERDGRLDMLLDVGSYRIRAFAARGATGNVSLAAQPFLEAAPPRALLPPGQTLTATLADKQQRAFWLLVPPSGQVDIEAAGRALADLRLWQNGRDLAALSPSFRAIEPQPGQPLTDLHLVGTVEPGIYLAVAYGGPATVWTNGSTDSPFAIRTGLSDALAAGWSGGSIGPLGSERFAVPAFAGTVRLDLPQPADATLLLDGAAASLSSKSREPIARLRGPAGKLGIVEVRGAAGQRFTLRATESPGEHPISKPGSYWVSAITEGVGGDEVPPTLLLERTDPQSPARIVASALPRLGPGTPWHGRFNLRGPTALLFENPDGGPVTTRTTGLSLQNDPGSTGSYDLPAGYYVLRLTPERGTQGAIDLAVSAGPASPGGAPTILPPDPVLPLGVQTVGPQQSLVLSAQSAPGAVTFLSARPVPVALAEGPLWMTQQAGAPPLSVPVRIDPGGSLAVSELGGAPIAVSMAGADVVIPAADHARTVVLAWQRATAAIPDIPPPPLAAAPHMEPGRPIALDLAKDEHRSFSLQIPIGGLWRIETTGRMHTAGRLATSFLPNLASDDAGGVGDNMLLQTFLRAGRYRVEATAKESGGHLGLVAGPAPLAAGATLVPDGSVRATMPAGAGVVFPLHVETEGDYHLDLLGIGRPFVARLDDSDGWPLTAPGDLSALDQSLRPGNYRLLIAPEPVGRRVIARLLPVAKPVAITGHGPHALPFADTQHATWREPPGRDDPRTPDLWRFSLAGPADVTLAISDGMIADLRSASGRAIARTSRSWTGRLEAGAYQVAAASLGRNDRLDYTLDLSAPQLQPGQVLTPTLPATIPFTLASARIATLATWGAVPVRAVLRRDDGTEIVRAGPRADDWNLMLSRPLAAGSYRLELSALAPPDGAVKVPQDPGVQGSDAAATNDDSSASDGQDAQTSPQPEADTQDQPSQGDTGQPPLELRLALPDALPETAPSAEPLTGAGVHVVRAPAVPPGALLLARAESDGATILTLERQEASGWRTVAVDQGTAPLVAAQGDADPARWRIEVWSVDGGAVPIHLTVRALDRPAAAAGDVTLRPVDGIPIAAARVHLDRPGLVASIGATAIAAWPGHAATPLEADRSVAQTTDLWLLGPGGAAHVEPVTLAPDQPTTISLPAAASAALPLLPAQPGKLLLWRADSGLAQPSLSNGGVAPGSALAPAATGAATLLRNADGDGAMRARTTLLALAIQPPLVPGALTLPPASATPVTLPGPGQVTVTLPAGTAAIGQRVIAWAPDAALTRTLSPGASLILVNTLPIPAPVTLTWQATPLPTLQPGGVFKQFVGADGSLDLATTGAGTLAVAGDATLDWLGDDGMVRHGSVIEISGDGHAIVAHRPGAIVVSLASLGHSPWPHATPEPVTPPRSLPLAGAAMALSITRDAPALLDATTTAPVLIGLGDAPPELFAAGAEFHRAIAAGSSTLRLYSPHDGPLSGTLVVDAEPLRPLAEGIGPETALGPGQSAAFAFDLAQPATIGVGVRATPDRVQLRLLDAAGTVLGTGVAQLRTLAAGRYVLEARNPADAPPALIRPAVVGITPRGSGPPPEIAARYRTLVGLMPEPSR